MTEALHPYNVFHEEGFEVDLVSETGSYQPDWLSTTKDWLPEEDRKVWEDASSEFRKKLDAHLKPSDIKPEKVSGSWLIQRRWMCSRIRCSMASSSPPRAMFLSLITLTLQACRI